MAPIIGALMGVWIWVGYLVLMKRYAFLAVDSDSDASGSLNRSQSIKEPSFINDQIQSESNSFSALLLASLPLSFTIAVTLAI